MKASLINALRFVEMELICAKTNVTIIILLVMMDAIQTVILKRLGFALADLNSKKILVGSNTSL